LRAEDEAMSSGPVLMRFDAELNNGLLNIADGCRRKASSRDAAASFAPDSLAVRLLQREQFQVLIFANRVRHRQ